MKKAEPCKLIWLDECGVDEETQRPYARSPKGQRVYGDIPRKRTHKRMTVIAGYLHKKLIAPFRFKGYTNTTVFETWVESCLVPLLVIGQIIIMDNATFHKAQSIQDKIEAAGATVLFLPPYSPDLNKIEPQWSVLKSRLRKNKDRYAEFLDNLDAQLKEMST